MTLLPVLLAVSFLNYFEARNQVANFVIDPPEAGQEVQPMKPNLIVRTPCMACEGEGQLLLVEPNFGQANGRLGGGKKTRKTCPLCRGRKHYEGFMTPADLKMQVARDREMFASRHQAKGELPVGEAFVPNKIYDSLEKDKLKMIEKAYGKPCKTCTWTGLEPCKKCRGRGVDNCPQEDCKGGFLVTKTTIEKTRVRSGSSMGGFGRSRGSSGSRRSSTKETRVTVQICPTCGGGKYVFCQECGGRKAHPCKKCNGMGINQKKSR